MTGVSANCDTAADRAESATLHAFLNCYLRETEMGEIVDRQTILSERDTEGDAVCIPFTQQGIEVVVPLRYESPTGRHLFDLPAFAREDTDAELNPLDAGTLAALGRRELALTADEVDLTAGTDLLRRVLASRRTIEQLVRENDDTVRAADAETTFYEAEQSLVYGHHLHPTPKSREGIADHEARAYAPELGGAFQLRYFAADRDLVSQWFAGDVSSTEWIRVGLDEAKADLPDVAERVLADGYELVPTHPWQASYLRSQPHVEQALDQGSIIDLGAFGPTFYPTSSVRTLWSPAAPFMVKSSLAVEITNSERTSKVSELKLGVAAAELLDTGFGDRLAERFPRFSVVRDPAALTLDLGDGSESGFETVLRDNTFRGERARNVTPIAALCQDGIDGPSRLARVISALAERTGRPTSDVAREWFCKYMAVTLSPVVWTYFELGIGLEAHQQNVLIRLDSDGWPAEGFYRDNEGFFVPESRRGDIDAWLPGVCDRIETVCPDETVDDCVRYYAVLNNAFGVINALGVAGLVDETALLEDLRAELDYFAGYEPPASTLVTDLLEEPTVPCKGNLRTRLEGRDELAASLEEESVYVDIENPLVTRL
ncbi:IucA/IucC family siderophore biosynthesis protein [Halogeometricum borinquense]|uniref:IucA/IucC family siderophore biosynthesis protein n=1 Tax=Halogeometricum borinquense TaxID=60847 RepID=A0A6C0UT15_9EURY|nr:IucA/IucC family protein [Halogeometricum borinquense]QIB76088.1 IucA/IucC family siderophore biosynthesis protein [Halogeometricum borinquense]